jgi:DNA-binding LytR/AlgR family response regulator
MEFVEWARGNNQNMVIRLSDGKEIPVSRSKAGLFREKIRKN